MRIIMAGVLVALAISCGGGGSGSDDDASTPIDAPSIDASESVDAADIDASGQCDPLAAAGAQGCGAGQKCTWIRVAETPDAIGMLGCVPDGTAEAGEACTTGPAGETTGYDDCNAGGICIGDTCQDICDLGGAAPACDAGYQCAPYAGLFANGDEPPVAGACAPLCNPLTQLVTGGQPCPVGQGCYTLTSATTTTAVCADASSPLTHGQPITGAPNANSCAPRHAPRRTGPGLATYECGALCAPADVTATTNMASEGGVAPHTCEALGASPPDSATQGESCRYFWAREPFEDLSPFSNTLGFCWKHAIWQYDTNGDMVDDAPFPRCITLTTGDIVPPIGNPPHNDAEYFWCVALPTAAVGELRGPQASFAEPQLDRLSGW